MTYIGQSLVRVRAETIYDPQRGVQVREHWEGTPTALQTLAATWYALGFKPTISEENGKTILTVDVPDVNSGSSEQPTDKWTVSTDFIQESLWASSTIQQQIRSISPSPSQFDATLAECRRICEMGLKGYAYNTTKYEVLIEGNSSAIDPADLVTETITDVDAIEILGNIYKRLLRGGEAYETERIIVGRQRTFSSAYVGRMVMSQSPTVYTTASFISTFGVPAVVQVQLPAAPTTTPTGTTWSWKVRKWNSDVRWDGRVEEVMEFCFAAWDTQLLYTLQE